MLLPSWLRAPRIRRGLAVSAVVLSAGGLVLFRASAGGAAPLSPILISTLTPASGNAATFSGPGAHGSIAISHTRVLAGGEHDLYADVRIVADHARAEARAPLSLAVVLDTSGSMDGEKIEDARNSVIRLIRDMRDDDEIAVVRYSDTPEVVQSLARVGDVRSSLISKVRALSAGGGTAIPRGLASGMSALEAAGRGRVRRVVLVSDGLDSTRSEAERLASTSFEKGITVSSLGIGLDFDESYMSSLSRSGHGNFGFVKDSGALATFLSRELNETATTTIEGATVRIKLPSGVRFSRATGADAREVGDNEVELRVGSLFAGDERRVVMEMTARVEAGETRGFDAHASWTPIGGSMVVAPIARLSVSGTLDPREAEESRDPVVMASAISVLASRRQLEAAEAYSRGDVGVAQGLIDKNMVDLKTAQAGAPPPMAAAMDRQWAEYDNAKKTFATAKPRSAEGNAAAKSAVEKDMNNLGRSAY
jgi:Ca-activated chloride channel family protein